MPCWWNRCWIIIRWKKVMLQLSAGPWSDVFVNFYSPWNRFERCEQDEANNAGEVSPRCLRWNLCGKAFICSSFFESAPTASSPVTICGFELLKELHVKMTKVSGWYVTMGTVHLVYCLAIFFKIYQRDNHLTGEMLINCPIWMGDLGSTRQPHFALCPRT